jgi:hypothetical protein
LLLVDSVKLFYTVSAYKLNLLLNTPFNPFYNRWLIFKTHSIINIFNV